MSRWATSRLRSWLDPRLRNRGLTRFGNVDPRVELHCDRGQRGTEPPAYRHPITHLRRDQASRRRPRGRRGGGERSEIVSYGQLSLPPDAVASLTQLLVDLAAVPGIPPGNKSGLPYTRDQVADHLPAIEGLVIAGLLHEAPERLALDPGTGAACRWWSAALLHALNGNASTLSWKAAGD